MIKTDNSKVNYNLIEENKKLKERINQLEKQICTELCDKCKKENHLQKLTDQAQDLGLGYD